MSLGIDHPLVLVRDIAAASARYEALGFRMTPVGKHPWGTFTAAAVFPNCLLELMGVYDEGLIDGHPAGDFRFGRFIRDHLMEREGVSLLALNSMDAEADVADVASRGVPCQGTIEFGRDVVLPDGRPDRTATTLKILRAPGLPRLSNFACQQHRRDLIEPAKWLDHPNGAVGLARITILAEAADHGRVSDRLVGLYGRDALFRTPEGFGARTGGGDFVVLDRAGATALYGPIPEAIAADPEPCYLGIHVAVRDVDAVRPFLAGAGCPHRMVDGTILVTDAPTYGNVFLGFVRRGT